MKRQTSFLIMSICFSLLANAQAESSTNILSLKTTADIVAYAKPAVVFIRHRNEAGQQSSGTGFLVHQDGTIITCAHLVKPQPKPGSKVSDKVWVRLYDGCTHEAERISCDPSSDLAVLQIKVREYPFLDFANSVPSLGEEIIVIGYPMGDVLGKEPSVTRGIISAVRFSGTAYQLAAAVNPGNSGGPALNKEGDIVGVLSFKVKDAEGMAFAVAPSLLPMWPSIWESRDGFRPIEKKGLSEENYQMFQKARRHNHIIHNTRPPLHRAAIAGDVEQVKKLISQGCDINFRDADGRAPLNYASILDKNFEPKDKKYRSSKLEIAKLLIDKGANVNNENNSGSTPLHEASMLGFGDCVKLLIEHGANVNAQGSSFLSETPLHAALITADDECVRILLENGANVNVRNKAGETPLSVAIERAKYDNGESTKIQEIIRMLKEQGAHE